MKFNVPLHANLKTRILTTARNIKLQAASEQISVGLLTLSFKGLQVSLAMPPPQVQLVSL